MCQTSLDIATLYTRWQMSQFVMDMFKAHFIRSLCSIRNSLLSHTFRVAEDPVRSAANDAAGRWELSANTHQVDIDITSRLTTFINAPVNY